MTDMTAEEMRAACDSVREFTRKDLTSWRGDDQELRYSIPLTDGFSSLLHSPLSWQKMGLQQTASGYGAKLTSEYKILYEGRFYRLYHTCYGNSSSCWFKARGLTVFVS